MTVVDEKFNNASSKILVNCQRGGGGGCGILQVFCDFHLMLLLFITKS